MGYTGVMSAENLSSKSANAPTMSVDLITRPLPDHDLNDLCDATDAAIKAGGGFGWLELPSRETLERYWQGVITVPQRLLFVARLDNVICGTCQLIRPPVNNEAQRHSAQITALFVSPWARGHGLSQRLLERAESEALSLNHIVINLDVRETQTRAIEIYEAAGYTQIGQHPHYAMVDGQFIPGRYYTKLLKSA